MKNTIIDQEPELHKKGSFLKQAAILATAGLLVRFIGFLYRLPLTNLIGDVGNAIYASGYYVYNFFLIISSAGFPAAVSKMVAERMALKQYANAHKVFKVSLIFSGGLGLISALVLAFGAETFAALANSEDSYYSLLTLAPTVFIVAIMASFRGYFQGMNTTVPTAISQIVEQIFNAIFSVVLAYAFIGKGVAYGAAGGTAGTGIGALAGLLFILFAYILVKPLMNKRIKASRRLRPESNKKILKILIITSFPVIIGMAVFSLTNFADMFMVMSLLKESGFSKEASEAMYGQLAGKYVVLTTLPVSLATAFATVAVPNITTSYVANDTAIVKKKVDMALRITMMITVPAAVGLGVLGNQILLLLFPDAPEGGILLNIGAIAIIFLSLTQICTGALQGINKIYIPAVCAGFGVIVKIYLNYILIPQTGINVIGAVISTIACYMVAGFLDFGFLMYFTKIKPDLKSIFLKPIAAAAVMGLACYSFYYTMFYITQSNTISTLVAIGVSILVYLLFMFFIRGIEREDVLLFPNGEKIAAFLESFRLL